jgi:hypothetical protein
VIRQRTICPFVKRKQEQRCLLSGTLNTAVPCELQPPLRATSSPNGTNELLERQEKQCHCVFSEDASLLVGLFFR